jgi:hypothetical protein
LVGFTGDVILVSFMASSHLSFSVLSWNIRGLGDPCKCDLVKHSLLDSLPDITLLQEIKLANINVYKSFSFLPGTLKNFISLDASGSSRGLFLAWNSAKFKMIRSSFQSHIPFLLFLNLSSMPSVFGYPTAMALT